MRILLLSSCADTSKPLLNILYAEQYRVTYQASLVGSVTATNHAFDLVLLDGRLTAETDSAGLFKALALHTGSPVFLYNASGYQMASAFCSLPGIRCYPHPLTAAQLLREVVYQEVRHCAAANAASITLADLYFDAYKKTVTRAGELIKLTLKEFLLLKFLLMHKNCLVRRTDIIQQLWGANTVRNQNSLSLYIHLLRGKIDTGHTQPLLHTVHGQGYILKGN